MPPQPVARMGDTHVCPLHGTNVIVTGAAGLTVNHLPVAGVGDQTTCGATILTGAPGFTGTNVLVAHVGSATSHGGVITTGSPDTLVGAPEAPALAIDDPPLEPVPLLPLEAAQVLAELAEEGLGLSAIVGALVGGITRGIGNKLPLGKAIEKAAENSRSAGEALGKAGTDQAKKQQGVEKDKEYIDRYHGPDELARDDEAGFNQGLALQLEFYRKSGIPSEGLWNTDEGFICDHAVALSNLAIGYQREVTVEDEPLPPGLLMRAGG